MQAGGAGLPDGSLMPPTLPVTESHPCEGAVRRWEHKATRRYYEARMVRDLFGEWQLMRVWGGIGSARGALRFAPLAEPGAFADELARIDKRRVKRGYVLRP